MNAKRTSTLNCFKVNTELKTKKTKSYSKTKSINRKKSESWRRITSMLCKTCSKRSKCNSKTKSRLFNFLSKSLKHSRLKLAKMRRTCETFRQNLVKKLA